MYTWQATESLESNGLDSDSDFGHTECFIHYINNADQMPKISKHVINVSFYINITFALQKMGSLSFLLPDTPQIIGPLM